MFAQLQILGEDPIAVLLQRDLGDLEHRPGLIDVRLGREVPHELVPLFILECGFVELGDDVSALDTGAFGEDRDNSGRARSLLHPSKAAAATAATSTSATATTAAAATSTTAAAAAFLLLGVGLLGGIGRFRRGRA